MFRRNRKKHHNTHFIDKALPNCYRSDEDSMQSEDDIIQLYRVDASGMLRPVLILKTDINFLHHPHPINLLLVLVLYTNKVIQSVF